MFGVKKLQKENAALRAMLAAAGVRENTPDADAARDSWIAPAGYTWQLGDAVLDGVHCLIAGTTGCGKSTLINSIIFSALAKTPADARLILCDPKRVELYKYSRLPHVLRYAEDAAGIVSALEYAVRIMEKRYIDMRARGIDRYAGGPEICVIIDELADLMIGPQKKAFSATLQRLLQLARAAGIHVIAATQAPNRKIIPAEIVLNFPQRIGLRCLSSIESRQIVNKAGCEDLPAHGIGYFINNCTARKVEIPLTPPEDIAERVAFWEAQV